MAEPSKLRPEIPSGSQQLKYKETFASPLTTAVTLRLYLNTTKMIINNKA